VPGPDGKLTAREVLVFPETARGTREGYSAWDFGANSTMTNANVDTVVQGTSGRNLGLGGFKLEVASPSSAKIDARATKALPCFVTQG
jgi:hypothetical protein